MMEWFKAGGFGMFVILGLGAAGIGHGINTLKNPTKRRAAMLRSFPLLILSGALFAFGTNLWAVYGYVTGEAEKGISDATGIRALIGFTEAAQALTLGGVLTLIVVALRMVVDGKMAESAGD